MSAGYKRLHGRARWALILLFSILTIYGCFPQSSTPTADVNVLAIQMASTMVALTAGVSPAPPTFTPVPTALPLPVELQNYAVRTEPDGQVMFSGYIANTGDAAIKGVQFKLKLFDPFGKQVAEKDELVCFIEPGGKRPFLSLMGYSPLEYRGVGIDFEQPAFASVQLASLAQSVQLDNVSLRELGMGSGELQGTITNGGQNPLPPVMIAGAIYDQYGNILELIPPGAGAVYDKINSTLMPGETSSWVVSINIPDPAQLEVTAGAFISNIPLPSEGHPCQ